MSDHRGQPYLHDLVTCVAAPTTVLSGADGQIRATGAQGVFVADVRVVSMAQLSVAGAEPDPVSGTMLGAGSAEFLGVVRSLGDPIPDPTVWVRRHRLASPTGCSETVSLINVTTREIRAVVEMAYAADLVEIDVVKVGGRSAPRPCEPTPHGILVRGARLTAHVNAPAAAIAFTDAAGGPRAMLRWEITVPARGRSTVGWSVRVDDPDAVVVPPGSTASFRAPRIVADDRRLSPFVARAVEDLAALRMSAVQSPEYQFIAAGSPWYLTLFGRDSLWTARMMLPLGTDIAAGTLHTLAARQGTTLDVDTAEEPGKILHEIRRGAMGIGTTVLPPVYYGTVDATPLWICLLADAWRWGLAEAEVADLLPAAERALEWMADYGDSDGDGFLEYIDRSGRGLSNQGWKDSADSVRFADGRIAHGPIALAEVQGYAHEAALAGADLLEAFGRPGADRWREYAARLQAAFRSAFWVRDSLGRYPALALDGAKRPVDAPASNMGHLLGTGLLSAEEATAVADRLLDSSMCSGFGLRTMASTAGGYSPLSYHCGSVWPHDTAIAVHGLVREGLADHAARLAEGLLAAGAAFDGRLPELYGGFDAAEIPAPVAYPASCRPQGWSAAAAVVMVTAFLGVEADVPRGLLRVTPSARIGSVKVSGLRVGGRDLHASVAADGSRSATVDGGGLRVETPSFAAPAGRVQ